MAHGTDAGGRAVALWLTFGGAGKAAEGTWVPIFNESGGGLNDIVRPTDMCDAEGHREV